MLGIAKSPCRRVELLYISITMNEGIVIFQNFHQTNMWEIVSQTNMWEIVWEIVSISSYVSESFIVFLINQLHMSFFHFFHWVFSPLSFTSKSVFYIRDTIPLCLIYVAYFSHFIYFLLTFYTILWVMVLKMYSNLSIFILFLLAF